MLRKFFASTAGLLGAGALAFTLALGSAAPVAAASTAEPAAMVAQQGPGVRQGQRALKLATAALVRATAQATELTPKEVVQAVRDGQSLAQVAADNGSSGDAVVQAVVAKTKARLEKQVQAGKITQERADKLLQAFTTLATTIVNDTELGTKLPARATP